ncbi:MAG: hypothetical protein A4E35_00193 [Methanoregula sp. PtaU1.Bin051]|nr:MAG: hypothetical protein A4E35_00193 [Methanoregula sp. PtaU1.Bin051]
MFGRQERLAILLLLLVSGGVIAAHLILDYIGKRPFAVPYSDNTADGELVIVSGSVDRISVTRNGGHLILDLENRTIFIPNQITAGLALSRGTNITVIGTVQTFQGKKEIAVTAASDITINRNSDAV